MIGVYFPTNHACLPVVMASFGFASRFNVMRLIARYLLLSCRFEKEAADMEVDLKEIQTGCLGGACVCASGFHPLRATIAG